MASQDGGEAIEELPGESIGQRVILGLERIYDRYDDTRAYLGDYTPYVVRTLEVIVAAILFVGFIYWLYLYFVVGV